MIVQWPSTPRRPSAWETYPDALHVIIPQVKVSLSLQGISLLVYKNLSSGLMGHYYLLLLYKRLFQNSAVYNSKQLFSS